MSRVPGINPERERLIAYCTKRLEQFRRIASHRRAAECADEGEQTCRALLTELGAPGFEAKPAKPAIEVTTIEEFLKP